MIEAGFAQLRYGASMAFGFDNSLWGREDNTIYP